MAQVSASQAVPTADVHIGLAPMFQPFIPVPVVVELSARDGWAAFVDAVRNSNGKALPRETDAAAG